MSKRTEARLDEIIAMCDGDLRGALKALMLVNEHLETELEKFQSRDGLGEYHTGSLH